MKYVTRINAYQYVLDQKLPIDSVSEHCIVITILCSFRTNNDLEITKLF